LAEIAVRLADAGAASTGTLVPAPPAPVAATLVPGDLTIATPAVGAGILMVLGRLDIDATFQFSGVVVATGGVRVGSAGDLQVDGAVWLGPDGGPALVVDGTARIVAHDAALVAADALVPLPRLAALHAARDGP
jgi:hypothetical protein